MGFGVKCFQLGKVFQLVGGLGPAAVVRLYDDGVADFLNKSPRRRKRADHMMARHRHPGGDVAFLHAAFVLDALDKIVFSTGIDVKVGAHLGVHFQPVFVVGFHPVDLAVVEGKIRHRAQHLVVAAQIADPVILGQAVL